MITLVLTVTFGPPCLVMQVRKFDVVNSESMDMEATGEVVVVHAAKVRLSKIAVSVVKKAALLERDTITVSESTRQEVWANVAQ